MTGQLTDAQIEQVLHAQMIGHIGCADKDRIYVVPVTYVFHGGYIYVHSKEGTKVKVMRKHPAVCFQVDAVDNMTNWRSVMIWGVYEELTGDKEQKSGMKIMMDRLVPFALSETVRPTYGLPHPPEIVEKGFKPVAYRIRIVEKTGRFEKSAPG